MACVCGHPNTLCSTHPKCPRCNNYSTVFESGHREYRCTRCKVVFTRRTFTSLIPNNNRQLTVKAAAAAKENTMKKNLKLAKSSKKSAKAAVAERESTLQYTFVKMPKNPAADESIQGTVLAGIRKIKSGNLDEAVEAALRAGLGNATGQEPRNQVRVHLRRLHNLGAVRVTRNGAESKSTKTASTKKVKKTFKLRKA